MHFSPLKIITRLPKISKYFLIFLKSYYARGSNSISQEFGIFCLIFLYFFLYIDIKNIFFKIKNISKK
jgi:hypothetical protein